MKVCILGSGYVGLVTGASFLSQGHDVCFFDTNPEKIALIKTRKAPFYEPGLNDLLQSKPSLSATNSLEEALTGAEVSFITVGTPFGAAGEIDLSQVAAAATQIGQVLKASGAPHVVVVKSTVVPGTSQGLVKENLRRAAGRDISVCMNPEFLREGSAVKDFLEPDRIVVGCENNAAAETVLKLYSKFTCPKLVTSLVNAELIKYASNTLLATLISFSNEFASICETLPGADCDVVWEGLHLDRRLSPRVKGETVRPGILSYLRHGPGFGGSCFPKDLAAIRYFCQERGVNSPMLDSVIHVNNERSQRAVELLAQSLGGSLEGKRIALFGLSFKEDTDDTRDSPALKLALILKKHRANVVAFDPLVKKSSEVDCVESYEQAAEGADAIVISTSWPVFRQYPWKTIVSTMKNKVVFDPRSYLKNHEWPGDVRYLRLGQAPA